MPDPFKILSRTNNWKCQKATFNQGEESSDRHRKKKNVETRGWFSKSKPKDRRKVLGNMDAL